MPSQHRDVVEADRGVLAGGEPHEVPHGAGVVDAPGVRGPRVDLVAARVEVVGEAARDQVGPGDPAVLRDQPDALASLAEDHAPTGARVARQRGVRGRLHAGGVGAQGPEGGRRRRGERAARARRLRVRGGGRGQDAGTAEHGHDGDRERAGEGDDPAVPRPELLRRSGHRVQPFAGGGNGRIGEHRRGLVDLGGGLEDAHHTARNRFAAGVHGSRANRPPAGGGGR